MLNFITLKLNVCCTQLTLMFLKKINDDQKFSTTCIFMKNNFALKQNLSIVNDIVTDVMMIKTDLNI